MKPAPFAYHAPERVADAAALLNEFGDEAKVLAGGQSLVPIMALRLARFEHVVDLNRVDELRGIERTNGTVRIGAMTRQADIEHDPTVAGAIPLLAKATPFIGHFQIRNRGTIGGSLAHADPAAEYPAVAVALDAEFEVTNPGGTRAVPADEFFVSTFMTALDTDDVLSAIRFPVWNGRCGFAVEEVARRFGDFALTGAVCAVELDGEDKVARSAIGMFGMGGTPLRATDAEAAMAGASVIGLDLEEVGRTAAAQTDPPDDIHASATYRRSVGAVVVARALRRAIEEARRG
ncbi:MAG: xanthine dehydrogenase family protein subunit M [Acidimicrobiia bacterium]|nr:xanthine dehydrogenase family protein subunit M [Acidimicrobiia bacterium]